MYCGVWDQPADDAEAGSSNLFYKWGHLPVKSTSLLFFIFLSSAFSFLFWLFNTHPHISACLCNVTDSILGKKIHQEKLCLFFIYFLFFFNFNDEPGKLPRWNIYYTKCILLKRKLARDYQHGWQKSEQEGVRTNPILLISTADIIHVFLPLKLVG